MVDKMLRIAGRGEDGRAKAISTDDKGNPKIILVNRDIERLYFLDAVTLEDTSIRRTDTIQLSAFRKVTYVAINTTDVPVRVRPQVDDAFVSFFESGEFKVSSVTGIIVPPSNTVRIILNDALPRVLDRPVGNMRFSYNAQETPSNNGTFSIFAWGVRN